MCIRDRSRPTPCPSWTPSSPTDSGEDRCYFSRLKKERLKLARTCFCFYFAFTSVLLLRFCRSASVLLFSADAVSRYFFPWSAVKRSFGSFYFGPSEPHYRLKFYSAVLFQDWFPTPTSLRLSSSLSSWRCFSRVSIRRKKYQACSSTTSLRILFESRTFFFLLCFFFRSLSLSGGGLYSAAVSCYFPTLHI